MLALVVVTAIWGYTFVPVQEAIAVYPLTMLNVSIQAMRTALTNLRRGERAAAAMEFDELKQAVEDAVLREGLL